MVEGVEPTVGGVEPTLISGSHASSIVVVDCILLVVLGCIILLPAASAVIIPGIVLVFFAFLGRGTSFATDGCLDISWFDHFCCWLATELGRLIQLGFFQIQRIYFVNTDTKNLSLVSVLSL